MEWTKLSTTAPSETEGGPLAIEKRSEKRLPASGSVRLAFHEPEPRELKAQLFDYSRKGFRAGHRYSALRAGQEVQFRHSKARGRARVVWNRIVQDYVESGFIVLE